ncbi:nickel pincer cofactor biosynthesis protein LarC [Natronospora cellulosivora (SeqCode)]
MDAYFDMFSGISGNMVLGALIDLGLNLEDLNNELDKLGLSDEYRINVKKVIKQGISASYVDVELLDEINKANHTPHPHSNAHKHNHGHEHVHEQEYEDEYEHTHKCVHDHKHEHSHEHSHGRNLSDINKIIDKSSLDIDIKKKSKAIFLRLAEAEAKIHGTTIEEIHFHEVGAVDAIVDIVGSVIGLNILGVENVYASKINTGTGFVNCQHGKMPVPAPATMEILKNVPVYSTGIRNELVTPTGAAIITTLAKGFLERPEMKIESSAYGAGSHDLEIPNLLRINLVQILDKELLGVKKN